MSISLKFKVSSLMLMALLGTWGGPVLAQIMDTSPIAGAGDDEPIGPDPEYVISASRIRQEAGKVGSTVTVLTESDIKDSGLSDLPSLLATVPGLEVLTNGSAGQATSFFTRGSNSNQTAVYVDGLRLQTTGFGSYDLGTLSLAAIERIEIVRGPQSAVGGSDAMGGSIHIFTRRGGGDPNLLLRVELGERKTASGSLNATGAQGPVGWSLTASRESSEGWSAASESRGNEEKDGLGSNLVAGRLGLMKFGDWELSARRQSSRVEVDAGANLENLEDFNLRDQVQASLSHRLDWTEGTRHLIRLGTTEDRLEDPGLGGNWPYLSYVRNISAEAQVETDHGSFQEAFGVSLLREEDRYTKTTHATTAGLFGEGSLPLPRGGLALGTLRVEQRRSQDEVLSPVATHRVSLRQPLAEGFALKGGFGTAHRYPGLGEFFPPWGNPALKPERSLGREAGLDWRSGEKDTELSLAWFRTDYEDLIQSDAFFVLQNIARARTEGAEFLASQRKGKMTRSFSYSRVEARDLATGDRLPRRARHKIAASGAFTTSLGGKTLTLFATARAEFDRQAGVFDPGPMDDYLRADAGLRVEVLRGLLVQARVENIGDRVYEAVPGFTTPRRNASLSLELDALALKGPRGG